MAVLSLGANNYQGLSSDTKPTNIADNSTFYETDTNSIFRRISGEWIETAENMSYSILVYKDGSNYKAKSHKTGRIISSSTTGLDTVVNDVLNNHLNASGGLIMFGEGDGTHMIVNNPIVCPIQAEAGFLKNYSFIGIQTQLRGLTNSISGGTHIKASATFPTNRYIFEAICPPASNKAVGLVVRNMYFSNPTPRLATGVGTHNNASNVGGIKFQNDQNQHNLFYVSNIMTDHLWRGIHGIGRVWGGAMEHCYFRNSNVNAMPDSDIILETRDRDQVGGSDHIELPGLFRISNTMHFNSPGGTGTVDTNACAHNTAISFVGAKYCTLEKVFVNGTAYKRAVISLDKAVSNIVDDVYVTDLNFTHASMLGIIVLDSLDGIINSLPYPTFDNKLYNLRLGRGNTVNNPEYSITFLNGAFRNLIHISQTAQGAISFNDTNAGIYNVAYIHEGQTLTTGTNLKATRTSTNFTSLRIRDMRAGGMHRGFSQASGNGSTTAFNITHGLFTTPTVYMVNPLTPLAQAPYTVTPTSTSITVTYDTAPPSGAVNNLRWSWYAEV